MLVLSLFLVSAGVTLGARELASVEAAGGLDPYKPTWVLTLQLRSASLPRSSSLEYELVSRARGGMSRWAARSLVDRWRRDRATGVQISRFERIAEALFSSGLVPPGEIESHTRGLLQFSIAAPERAASGEVVAVSTRIELVGSTSLRFEIVRARFSFGGRPLLYEPEPHVTISDAGGAGSTSGMSHQTTNYMAMQVGSVRGEPLRGELEAVYQVRVYSGGSLVSQWDQTTVAPMVLVPAKPG